MGGQVTIQTTGIGEVGRSREERMGCREQEGGDHTLAACHLFASVINIIWVREGC